MPKEVPAEAVPFIQVFTTQFTCFTGTKVQILTPEECGRGTVATARYVVYLLYWYKITNTDAEALCCYRHRIDGNVYALCLMPLACLIRMPLACLMPYASSLPYALCL